MTECIHDKTKLYSNYLFFCEDCGKEFTNFIDWVNEHYNRHIKKTDCRICGPIMEWNEVIKRDKNIKV